MHKLLTFKDESLLRHALTHRSYINENPGETQQNERLEFLGDAILNFLSGEYLYSRYPEMGEDQMTRRRAALVDEKQLAKFAIEVGLDFRMRLGKGAILDGGYQNPNLLSSTFEAVIGAYYLDNDRHIETIRPIVEQLFDSVPPEIVISRSNVDSKIDFKNWFRLLSAQLRLHMSQRKSADWITLPNSLPKYLWEITCTELVEGEARRMLKNRRLRMH